MIRVMNFWRRFRASASISLLLSGGQVMCFDFVLQCVLCAGKYMFLSAFAKVFAACRAAEGTAYQRHSNCIVIGISRVTPATKEATVTSRDPGTASIESPQGATSCALQVGTACHSAVAFLLSFVSNPTPGNWLILSPLGPSPGFPPPYGTYVDPTPRNHGLLHLSDRTAPPRPIKKSTGSYEVKLFVLPSETVYRASNIYVR
ncbi:hypothetical protein BDV26DRAFT_172056 [Aspergillus bertholletiae]|uniref:Uncharacterized protein n=1 Tax=Aspergillus bertholletiae TaxID=1226010 RepID=A0A5N7BC02_9EURO|nr:hypothetical protein BDV26DRAFT_172056 [Aspergillus bertholletiae]